MVEVAEHNIHPTFRGIFLQITTDSLCFFHNAPALVTGSQDSPAADSTVRDNLKNQVDTLERLYLEKAIVSHLSDIGRVWIALRFTGVYEVLVQKTHFVDLIR